jgi:adiponectin receptor
MGCSTIFHLFCCHSQESCLKYQKLDYLGICGIIFGLLLNFLFRTGSFIPIAYFGFFCNPAIKLFYILLMAIGCAVTIYLR